VANFHNLAKKNGMGGWRGIGKKTQILNISMNFFPRLDLK
jgi:hypothetical protein